MDDDSDAYKYCRLINDISYIFLGQKVLKKVLFNIWRKKN